MKTGKFLVTVIYFIFFLSGATGLIYQVVWIRQLVVVFGSTIHSTVAVISAFMSGLALGSYIIGKYSNKVKNLLYPPSQKTESVSSRLNAKRFPLRRDFAPDLPYRQAGEAGGEDTPSVSSWELHLYAALEFAVGILSLSTFITFPLIRLIYQNTFELFSGNLLIILAYKFVLASLVILPATCAMGGTLPALIMFVSKKYQGVVTAASRLYAVNTLGAFFGTVASAYIFIELFGLRLSILFTAVTNIGISAVSLYIAKVKGSASDYLKSKTKMLYGKDSFNFKEKLTLFIFSLSGFVSLSYEILWTRLLTPSVGTFIYAFALILSVYLIGIAAGSYIFEKLFSKNRTPYLVFGLLELGIGLSALASVIFNSNIESVPSIIKVICTIIPGTLLMGMTFPAVVAIFSSKNNIGSVVGGAYAGNTIGSIAGSILAGYLIIPFLGTVKGIIILSVINFILAYLLVVQEKAPILIRSAVSVSVAIIIAVSLWLMSLDPLVLQEAETKNRIRTIRTRGNYEEMFMEDEIATVLGYRQIEGGDKALFIDGVQTTSPGPDTTLLAHIPVLLHGSPEKMLVIAFGMGGTYRSALLHENLSVDAVDLVPSVPKMFRLFHDDAEQVLANPRGKIIIDDGRNYVRTSKESYDIIVIDPPPPINAAGTTVLYSREFYNDSKKILNKGGLFTAWFYTGATVNDFKSLFKSFTDEFVHVLAINSVITSGIYLVGSDEPIVFDDKLLKPKFLDPKVYYDNNKTILDGSLSIKIPAITVESICERIIGNEEVLKEFIGDAKAITDDRPRTEYFLLGRKLHPSTLMRPEYVSKFNKKAYCGPAEKTVTP